MRTVRVKLFKPCDDNFGTRFQPCQVDDYGKGVAEFVITKQVHYTKFKVATEDNAAVLQELVIERSLNSDKAEPVDPRWPGQKMGVHAGPGDVIRVAFVVHAYAFRVSLNDDPGDDEEDLAVLAMVRTLDRLKISRQTT